MKWLLLSVFLPSLTLQQCLSPDDSKLSNVDHNERLNLYKGQQEFSLKLLQTVNSLKPTENIFFSPLSVYSTLLLAFFISANQTEAALKKALYLPDKENKLSTMQAYMMEKYFQQMRPYNGSSSFELSTPNQLFVSQQQKVRECMQQLFKDEITVIDFAKDPSAATKQINKWVADQTKNQIKDLIQEGQLSYNTNLVLCNAAYFKGVWKSRFQPDSTKKDIFYISASQNTHVTMMRQKSTFNHLVSEKLGSHVLELPYKGDEISMFILLPPFASPNGISNILKRLTIENFQEIIEQDNMIPRPVDVSIPKFSIEQELEMVSVLESFGVGDLFQPTANLSALTGKSDLTLNKAVHKAKIKVDEEGTTAAAATALFNFRSSRPLDPARFICNHPFVYLLFDKTSKTVLFMGVFNKPNETF